MRELKDFDFDDADVLFCANDRLYYFQRRAGDYVGTSESSIKKRLVRLGFSPYADTRQGEYLSPLDERMLDIEESQRVDYAMPVAGYPVGVYEQGNERILITKELDCIEPRRGEWDILRQFIEGLLDGGDQGFKQTPYFYAWLARAMSGLQFRRPNSGQALLIAGDPDCGKTLLTKILRALFGGRVGKPYEYLTGQTRFNNELFSTSLQVIDDEADKTDIKSRRHLVAGLKKFIGADGARGEAKGGITFEIQPHWRVVMVANFEEDNLRVFPPLDEDVIDKLILLRGYKSAFPMPTRTQSEQEDFLRQMLSELPAFMFFLLNEFEIPEEIRFDRFGVRSILNPDIVARMDQITPWHELSILMEHEVLQGQAFWVGTATELYTGLRHRDSSLTMREKERYTPKGIGMNLTRISRKFPERCYQVVKGRKRLWVFVSERANPSEEKERIETKIFERAES